MSKTLNLALRTKSFWAMNMGIVILIMVVVTTRLEASRLFPKPSYGFEPNRGQINR